jgi:hypothetical protein
VSKIIPFLFASVLLWQGLGSFVYFQFERKAIRKEIKSKLKAGVPKEELVEFRFSKDQFQKLKWRKSNEFVIANHFYDVVKRVNNTNDSIVLKCISDKQEDKLFTSLGIMVSSDLHKKHPESSPVHWKTLTGVIYIQPVLLTIQITSFMKTREYRGTYLDTHSSKHAFIFEKPPST